MQVGSGVRQLVGSGGLLSLSITRRDDSAARLDLGEVTLELPKKMNAEITPHEDGVAVTFLGIDKPEVTWKSQTREVPGVIATSALVTVTLPWAPDVHLEVVD